MSRLLAYAGLFAFATLAQDQALESWPGLVAATEQVSQQQTNLDDLGSRWVTLSPELDFGCDELSDAAINVGALVATRDAPQAPRHALAMPCGARAMSLWSRAIQECGPPRA